MGFEKKSMLTAEMFVCMDDNEFIYQTYDMGKPNVDSWVKEEYAFVDEELHHVVRGYITAHNTVIFQYIDMDNCEKYIIPIVGKLLAENRNRTIPTLRFILMNCTPTDLVLKDVCMDHDTNQPTFKMERGAEWVKKKLTPKPKKKVDVFSIVFGTSITALILGVIVFAVVTIVSCNQQRQEIHDQMNYAVIRMANGEVLEGYIDSWRYTSKYETQIDIIIDGRRFILPTSDVQMISKERNSNDES